MLYRQKFDTFIRTFKDIGYIVNKANYTDQVFDFSGAVFLKALSREPRTLEAITAEILKTFHNQRAEDLQPDVADFLKELEEDGFIVSGKSPAELDAKDRRFSYACLTPETFREDTASAKQRVEAFSQVFLDDYFQQNPYLASFQIELTSRCNERCVHCYIPHENKIGDIESGLFYSLLDQCRDMNVMTVTLSGGEPMLHPRFCDFLKKAKEYDFSINILTNLTLLNDEIIAEMKANRLSSVQVSLYSMDSEIHDSITKMPGSFEKTYKAILRLIDNDIPLQISCPVMKQNKDTFQDVILKAAELKVRATTDFIMMARYDHTQDNLDNRLDLEETGKVISRIIEYDRAYQVEMQTANLAEIHDDSEKTVCGVGVTSLCVAANGNVYPCAGWQDYVCGDAREQTLRDIWENSAKVRYLRSLRRKDFPECTACADKSFCAMCMVRNANEDPEGNPLNINKHFCKVAALNRKIVTEWKAKER